MFNKNKTLATAKFYNKPPKVEELYTGYLHKSPFSSGLNNAKSWKRRFFELSRTGDNTYELTYYKNEKKEKPSGKIDLSRLSLNCTSPEKHQMWDWIQRNFKCPASFVLLLRVEDFVPNCARDYFLIGENSDGVDSLHKELQKILKFQISQKVARGINYSLQQDNKCKPRSISEPIPNIRDCNEDKNETDQNFRLSAPTAVCISSPQPQKESHYAVPTLFREIHTAEHKNAVIDDEDNDEEQPKTPEDSDYMVMASLNLVLEQKQQEEEGCIQINTFTNGLESCDAAEKDNPIKRIEKGLRCSKASFPNFNGNSASTEISDTHTHVEKDICVTRKDLNDNLIITQEKGKPCVSECKQTEASRLFHKGDQILAFNDLRIETVDEIQTYLKRLSKNEVKLTVLRHPGSQPFTLNPVHTESCSH